MKKTLSIIFALAMVLCVSISTFALELDTAEAAAEAVVVTEEAVLNASGVTPSIPTYDATYGELIYYEAFDDNTWDKGYSIGSNAYFYGEGCTISVGDGYGIGGKATTLVIDNTYLTKLSKVTIFMDVKKAPGSAATGVSIWGDFGEGWPKFSVADVTEDAWTTKTATFSNVTLTRNNGRVVAYFNLTGLYADNIKIYADYPLEGKSRLIEGDKVFTVDKGTALPMPETEGLNAWKNANGDLWFAGAFAPEGETLSPCYSPIKYHAQYGELLYYEDFEDNSQSNAYNPIGANGFIWTGGTVVDNPVGSGKAFISSETYTQLNLDGNYGLDAKDITILVDFLNYDNVAGSAPLYLYDNWLDPWDYWAADSFSSTEWKTHTGKKTLNKLIGKSNGASTIQAYFGGKGKYVDNIRIYVNHSVSDKVRLAQNNDSVLYSVEGDTFTFPEISNASANAWECKDAGLVFAPGDSAAKADVLGKTFVAVKATVYIDENKGELIYLENFDDNTWDRGYSIGTNAYMYGEGCTLEMGDGYGVGNSPIALIVDNTYLTTLSKVTVNMDVKKTSGSTATGVNIWGDFGEKWPVFSVSDVTENAWTAKTGNFSNVTLTRNNGRIVVYIGAKQLYIDNVALYAVYNHPTGARFVETKFAPSTVVVPDGDTYTFASPKNLMYNAWTDGEKTYLAGSKIASSEIIGKLYYPVAVAYAEYTPKTEDTVEFRVNGNSAKNGIRFKASIAPSKKEAATEMGFIAARADVLSDMGEELTLDLPAEGTVFVRGVAYDKNGKNIIYGVNDDGTAEIFTAVCVGLDITNKAHVTTELSARPYMTVSISDGDAITVYGEVKTASYYSVANALKTAADNGDEAAKALYESADYEGGNYIDDIITTATAE